jgi:hypothetical protein
MHSKPGNKGLTMAKYAIAFVANALFIGVCLFGTGLVLGTAWTCIAGGWRVAQSVFSGIF